MQTPWKIGAFYLGTIIAVIAIISVVIDYGTNNLVAPEDISGQYKVSFAEQSACGQAGEALLVIGQSGSHLIADLLAHDATQEQRTRVGRGNGHLFGQLESQTIRMSGSSEQTSSCLNGTPLSLEATVAQGQLSGHLTNGALTVAISGQRVQ